MRLLINHIKRQLKSGKTVVQQELVGSRFTIGKGTDTDVFLPGLRVVLDHAEIFVDQNETLHIESKLLAGIRIDGRVIESGVINVGTVISVGEFQLTVMEPPEGFDYMIEVEQHDISDHPIESKYSAQSLAEKKLNIRLWSWAIFILIIGGFLIVPLTGFFHEPLRQSIRDLSFFSDRSWNTGNLANVHHTLMNDCNACHETAFVPVKDTACIQCHNNVSQHLRSLSPGHEISQFGGFECASCHQEHNSSTGLIPASEKLCVSCHSDIKAIMPGTEVADVSDFSHQHPQFKPKLFRQQGETSIRVSLDNKIDLKEQSGLFFNHKIHLNNDGIRRNNETVNLECHDCHLADSGGIGMNPIEMEKHCQSCHRLNFDAMMPDRELPHGQLESALYTLEEFYLSQALKGGYRPSSLDQSQTSNEENTDRQYLPLETPQIILQRRRPGVELTEEERQVALDWAAQKWRSVAEEMIEYRSCVTCHEIQKQSDISPGWIITPVKLADLWLDKAVFSHKEHRTEDCSDCHAVTNSEHSEDVLLPGIETCRMCHGGHQAQDRISSDCVSCHEFHTFTKR
jgi:predicted CXXCH cytochrome family protein